LQCRSLQCKHMIQLMNHKHQLCKHFHHYILLRCGHIRSKYIYHLCICCYRYKQNYQQCEHIVHLLHYKYHECMHCYHYNLC
jgi:hypothetical protein